jgi:hypothetical protein
MISLKKMAKAKSKQKKTAAKKTAVKKTAVKKKTARKRTARKRTAKKKTAKKAGGSKKPVRKWSGKVTETSDALDLKKNLFKQDDPDSIARSLKKSAKQSKRKKGTPYQSAMSMLNFYINRAGDNLSKTELAKLEKAKESLRKLFRKE